MADTTTAAANDAPEQHDIPGAPVQGGDHSADMSCEQKLQAMGEHMLAAHKLHAALGDHHDAISALSDHIRDGDGDGGSDDARSMAAALSAKAGQVTFAPGSGAARTLAQIRAGAPERRG
jgi:hypothetical protein